MDRCRAYGPGAACRPAAEAVLGQQVGDGLRAIGLEQRRQARQRLAVQDDAGQARVTWRRAARRAARRSFVRVGFSMPSLSIARPWRP